MQSQILQKTQISLMLGAKSIRDISSPLLQTIMGFGHLFIHLMPLTTIVAWRFSPISPWLFLLIFLVLVYLQVLAYTKFFGDTFHSAFLSPYRRYARFVGSLGSVLPGLTTYIVRRKGWSVLLAMAMGLEGYRYLFPVVEQQPSYVSRALVRYESMPKCAEERALAMRNAWIGRHLGDVAQTFSKMVITAADITSLLREIEADTSLVHAAYYTDDECVARIADWIAGRG